MDDNIYPLGLGDSIEPSATLQAWGFRDKKPIEEAKELEQRRKTLKAIILGTPQPSSEKNSTNDDIYPLNLGPSIEPSATLKAWGWKG